MDGKTRFEDEEKIIGAIFEVIGGPGKLKIIFRDGLPLWGDAEHLMPTNALFFTNQRLFFIFIDDVPTTAMEKVSAGLWPKRTEILVNLTRVKEKGEEMVATMTPEEIYSLNKDNIALSYDEIKEVKLRKWKENATVGDSFTIKTIDKRKYKYLLLNIEEIKKLEQMLMNVLPSKTTIESGKLIR
ncbi:hypothetical protein MBGDN05_00869 [Thermoplasmatales archaeon SCGC AB-539-N05]|nr:hypothetical protein MBGDN05_00869 [Thermoplasmatales archaeon SCGC AB-539-N05]